MPAPSEQLGTLEFITLPLAHVRYFREIRGILQLVNKVTTQQMWFLDP